jgi:hypothetical protein
MSRCHGDGWFPSHGNLRNAEDALRLLLIELGRIPQQTGTMQAGVSLARGGADLAHRICSKAINRNELRLFLRAR